MMKEKQVKPDQRFRIVNRMLRISAVTIILCTVLVACALVLPRLFRVVPYAVQTGSMGSALPVGSLVYVNTNDKAAQTDDVIAFTVANGAIVTHRVIAVQDGKYITQGDANTTEDFAPVSAAQVLGICVFHIPFIGYLFLIPAAKFFWITVALCAALYLTILRKKGTLS